MLGAMAAGAVQASVYHLAPPLEKAAWELDASAKSCELSQEIPHYGRGVFVQRGGDVLEFRLEFALEPSRDDVVTFAAVPPAWRHEGEPRELGVAHIEAGAPALNLSTQDARRLLIELEQGMETRFLMHDATGGLEAVVVAFSPVRFREALREFHACRRRLDAERLHLVSEWSVRFASSESVLDPDARRILAEAALMRKYRSNHLRFVLATSAASEAGGADPAIAERRVEAVKARLVELGVPEEKILTRFEDSIAAVDNGRIGVWLVR